tara:strand:+ start:451 stop:1056 length:606 start_codon:yes stop_codon:yes gene_type:complete
MKEKDNDKKAHYIDNKEFFKAMSEWKLLVNEANDMGEPRPPISTYIGVCFMKIAEHLSFKANFTNYPYKEEMIGDAIENCIMYAHNFDPDKSKNPFSYFTQITYYAFLRRIEKEKKQSYIKFKLLEQQEDVIIQKWYKTNYFEKSDNDMGVQDAMKDAFQVNDTDITKFTPKNKKKTRKKTGKLDQFMDKKDNDTDENSTD